MSHNIYASECVFSLEL